MTAEVTNQGKFCARGMRRFSLGIVVAMQVSCCAALETVESGVLQQQAAALQRAEPYIGAGKSGEISSFLQKYRNSTLDEISSLSGASIQKNGTQTSVTITDEAGATVTYDFIVTALRTVRVKCSNLELIGQFYESGQLSEYSESFSGKFNGVMLKLYRNGTIQYILHFSEGMLLGRTIGWKEDGQPDFDVNYTQPTEMH
jgi:antitoxin component YwqK of YwqJK toxin-antitoxin module